MLTTTVQNHLNQLNDIALLKIKEGADTLMKIPSGTSFQNNILTLNSDNNFDKSMKMSFAGWGVLDNNELKRPKVLQKTKIKLIGEKKCRKILNEKYRIRLGHEANSVLCADSSETDSCYGDSGGPLFRKSGSKWIVYGLASYGYGCANGIPAFYTNVNFHKDWIEFFIPKDKFEPVLTTSATTPVITTAETSDTLSFPFHQLTDKVETTGCF